MSSTEEQRISDAPFDPAAALARLASGSRAGRLLHVHEVPARQARRAEWPDWVHPAVYAAFASSGITSPWSHQAEAADLAWRGQHVVMATGTASGKSLGYLAPVLSSLVAGASAPSGRGATALYLSPTKALAADQVARLQSLAIPGLRAATYDGDTPQEERRWIREHAHLVLTNPDLVHHSLLPQHQRWAPFLRALRYVVIDECHVYRGVFGSHLAALLRRLRRVAARYGAAPTFVLASATVRDPAVHAERLTGLPVQPVEQDGSPRAAMTFGLWEPAELPGRSSAPEPGESGDAGDSGQRGGDGVADASGGSAVDASGETPVRRSATSEAADLLADLVAAGVQTVAFARSRAGVEALSASARRSLAEVSPLLEGAVAAYRGGYLPEERRILERALREGSLVGLAATNALELGIDISGLDAVLLAGWPGTRASLWQQAGRAGRAGTRSLAVLVAADDPLDTYLVHHPESLFGQSVEATVMDPENPHVLAPHLAAAAAELPLTEADLPLFGRDAPALVEALVARGILRRRPTGWYWARTDRASDHVSLRGSGEVVGIVERRTGRVLGTIDEASAHTQVHTGAVHVHQGETYVVTDLDLEDRTACVVRGDPGWSTFAQSVSAFDIVATERTVAWGPVTVSFGPVKVHTQVTSFLRRLPSGEVIGTHPLELPRRTLATKAVWWTMPVDALAQGGVDETAIPGAAHAAEHAAIGMLPLVATSDRWDIGGVSTALHPDTGLPTVLIYDGHPGGAGFAERGFEALRTWLSATRDAIAACGCERGCPACVQSPKCGNGNDPLDKAGAVALLSMVLRWGEAADSRKAQAAAGG
ncbi:DEAD/DEAH box helicase [Knoellia sp. p5-6-4]|uniref:DEAD/DEAH box helicase n=1 Tax=unclassified Knoellia TaxID=2618719 RepID=UPI0023DC6E64|nr:DEAD/DEAH box helicase [Knoellia sp. p5-6-4]MDF2144701.1 DEAD/DEAH box helicase [Knoellia sp. p5-6-4]